MLPTLYFTFSILNIPIVICLEIETKLSKVKQKGFQWDNNTEIPVPIIRYICVGPEPCAQHVSRLCIAGPTFVTELINVAYCRASRLDYGSVRFSAVGRGLAMQIS